MEKEIFNLFIAGMIAMELFFFVILFPSIDSSNAWFYAIMWLVGFGNLLIWVYFKIDKWKIKSNLPEIMHIKSEKV
jgi:hypothetical protein